MKIRLDIHGFIRQPKWMVLALFIVALGAIGWQTYELLIDKPLPESVVAAKRLRVETATLNSVFQRLEQYRAHPKN